MAVARLRLLLPVCMMFFTIPLFAGEKSSSHMASKDKCPVCGMFVAKFPDWTASLTLDNGRVYYFDGAKDMFFFIQQPEKYLPGKTAARVTDSTVKDYYSLKSINGKEAFFVSGSDVNGPMGRELIPFAQRKDAEGFIKDHRGKKIFRFGEVTMKILKEL